MLNTIHHVNSHHALNNSSPSSLPAALDWVTLPVTSFGTTEDVSLASTHHKELDFSQVSLKSTFPWYTKAITPDGRSALSAAIC